MGCAHFVFRCFRWLERMGDRLTGAAGPFFVGMAVVLLTTGVICFYEVVLPTLPFLVLTAPVCTLIVANMFAHYYYVCTVPPGFTEDSTHETGKGWRWARKRKTARNRALTGVRWSSNVIITKASITHCKKCGQVKPERTHHCRICDRCVLKFDHHCPDTGVNQCVGLYNERHFILFMAYLVIATFCFGVLGFHAVQDALGITLQDQWLYYMPQFVFILIYILSVVLCLAVGIMLFWHLWSISVGVTTVESQDHDVYRKVAKERGEVFVNSYDLGKRTNLELFFNIGESGYPLYTLFLPFRIQPYTDGRSWARRDGYERHHGIREGDELTDEDEGED